MELTVDVTRCLSRRRMLCLAVVPLLSSRRLAAEETSPAEVLRGEHGLTRRADKVWTLPAEARLRKTLADLPKLKESIVAADRALEERIEQNKRLWQEHAPARASLKQSLGKLSPSDPQRKAMQAKLSAMETIACDPAKLAGLDDVRLKLIQFGQDRTTLAISLLWLRSGWPQAIKHYAELAEKPEVQQALRQLGGDHRLGPVRNYDQDLRRLGEYERLVFTSWLPIHQQSGQTRVTAIANERSPLTFTWSETSNQPTVITSGALAALGLQVPADAPQVPLKFGKTRSLASRQMTLDSLRLARFVVQSVPVHVLPPEGEDLGSRIGRPAFPDHSVNLQPERLRMTIDA